MSRLRTAFVALVALAGLAACGADDSGASTGDEPATQSPAEAGGEPLALTADGSTAGKCAVPSAATLSTFDTAFAGTVTSIDGGTATLAVKEWYAGDEASTVTVTSPSKDLQDLLLTVDFQEGRTYLVSAAGGRVTLCGFTAEQGPELQALYDEAFGG